MANEISITISGTLTNGSLKRTFTPGSFNVTQTTAGCHSSLVSMTTAIEQLSKGDVATFGYCFLTNIDATNEVIYGPHSTTLVEFGRLKSGESAAIRVQSGTTIAVRSSAGTVKCLVEMWED